ncbi:hypothetical protein F8154_08375 [Alkaliphilus pronyensis]|uniref:Uncharacterized protein n=1 Tax=Alkaliphilus pronyensis TaxID=1482732 RepID=A0A6I0FFJ1_9FIRM|nr:hypothetical protein F8154_08375 [Alkaliphilus pronyensis]
MKGDGQLKYSEIEVKKMLKKGDLNLEDQIKFNILNFIRTIYFNELDFIESSFGTEFFGELPMTFQKKPGQVMGLITATIDGEVWKYVFNNKGYEPLEDLLELGK